MWFCPNDKDQCVLGDVGDFVKGKPNFPHVWLIFTRSKPISMEVASLEELDFVFFGVPYVDVGGANLDANDNPLNKCDDKFMHHAQPTKDLDNKWLFGKNLRTIMLQIKDIIDPEYGWVYSIHGGVMTITYKVKIGVIPNSTYFDFASMLTTLKNTKFYPSKTFVFHLWN
jgi:hypothetical protein